MKKLMLAAASLTVMMATPLIADEMKMDKAGMKHETMMCEKHCNVMDLEKEVKALKSREDSAGKLVEKEHLRKDIRTYEKKLQELKKDLE